jgi:GMP synthase-like glutamine amidotransferase
MQPIAIFQHAGTEGPGYFATYLDRHSLPWRLIRPDLDALPGSAREFSGLVFMGGPMSVNDDLPWIPRLLELIRDAAAADVPVLGHCLGGQLLSKALGGTVSRNPVKEIGWSDVEVADNAVARQWFGQDLRRFSAFQWHAETFTIPAAATPVLSGRHCANQGFALGKHLGLQCHLEMDRVLVDSWCATGAREIAESDGPAVQAVMEIQRDLAARLDGLHAVADRVYGRWTAGLQR